MRAHPTVSPGARKDLIAKKFAPLLLSAACILFGHVTAVPAAEIALGDLKLSDTCIRAMVPGAQVAGGYLTITNSGQTDDRLIGVSSEQSKKAEIHEMAFDHDVMIMRELPAGLAIPAGKSVKLNPGGYHLMFMDVTTPFKEGQVSKVTLKFERSGTVNIDILVGPAGAGCLSKPS